MCPRKKSSDRQMKQSELETSISLVKYDILLIYSDLKWFLFPHKCSPDNIVNRLTSLEFIMFSITSSPLLYNNANAVTNAIASFSLYSRQIKFPVSQRIVTSSEKPCVNPSVFSEDNELKFSEPPPETPINWANASPPEQPHEILMFRGLTTPNRSNIA